MTHFIHKILTNMLRAATEAIFRVILLQEHKGMYVVSCAAVTP
jgi:hypothetical protein